VKFTSKQLQALELIKQPANNTLFYGGSRSGKTWEILQIMKVRALQYPGSRHAAVRYRFNHAKISLWLDTLPKVMDDLIKADYVKFKESDHYIQFKNGSEIWVDGLDDKERVEKFLGREYCTMFFNEASQISYDSFLLCQTRLSQNIKGCRNRTFTDCNPPGRKHWLYKLYIQKLDPIKSIPKNNPTDYNSIQMNPMDNKINLPVGYIENTLDSLPESKRKRFLEGEFTDQEGVIFSNWSLVESVTEVVKQKARSICGLDFGYSIDPTCVVRIYSIADELWIEEMIYQKGLRNIDIINEMRRCGITTADEIIADSAEPKSIDDLKIDGGFNIKGALKGSDSIRNGIDRMLSKKIFITRSSSNVILEFENYCWKPSNSGEFLTEPIDDYNHSIDPIRYALEGIYGPSLQFVVV
jgi:PBSX family phage terminase large subunit